MNRFRSGKAGLPLPTRVSALTRASCLSVALESMPMSWKFDPTLNINGVATVLAVLAGAYGAYWALKQDDALMDQRLGVVERTIERMANQSERITALETTVRSLDDLPNLIRDLNRTVQQLDTTDFR